MVDFDVIVIGAASAGFPAAIYAKRFGLSTLVIGADVGGLLNESSKVENWPGDIAITGIALMQRFRAHATSLGIEVKEAWVTKLERTPEGFAVTTDHGVLTARAIIYTAGAKHRHLGAVGEDRLAGRGVSYCATCDAAFFKNVPVAVVGGGDSAAQAGHLLAQHASQVFMIVRKSEMRAEPINRQRLEEDPKVTLLYETRIEEVLGENAVERVRLSSPHDGSDILNVEGVFVAIGADPQSKLAKEIGVAVNELGEIIITGESRTNVPKFYAAGDVANRKFKQSITGAAEGVIAAFSAFEDLGG